MPELTGKILRSTYITVTGPMHIPEDIKYTLTAHKSPGARGRNYMDERKLLPDRIAAQEQVSARFMELVGAD